MITVEQIVSADGFAAEPDGGMRFVDATTPGDDLTDEAQLEMLASVEAILFGRRTYEMFAGYWPTADPVVERVAPIINRLPKLVVSSTLERAPWGDTEIEILRPEPSATDAVRGLEGRFGSIIVWGSLQLANALFEAGLVTRLRLRTCPVLIGEGLRFTPAGIGQQVLRLESATALPSGHLVSDYAVAPR
ncbi:dihydrofolate reductase family protein [Agrococcus sp. ARC_14]|uniref:dihydrofolate reductase family protein n=1 Tax=Agrococcus sp. ARC_14 TaxID=2919927 RepID=UPI001F06326F|nr:dihydrofolate reductase family protein [Agrococcus sp. ARC_14]MCH1881872.1 dihydrofolate reductase family protein [Agrococcus sp. ARC_14]